MIQTITDKSKPQNAMTVEIQTHLPSCKRIADQLAKALTSNSQSWNDKGETFGVTEVYEGGCELSLNGEAYAGGSYDFHLTGDIYLASAGVEGNGCVAYAHLGNDFKLAVVPCL